MSRANVRWIATKSGFQHREVFTIDGVEYVRTKTPELYQMMQPQRNVWWARKVYDLLASGGTHFVAIGQLHVLGSDGVPRQLERLGIQVESPP